MCEKKNTTFMMGHKCVKSGKDIGQTMKGFKCRIWCKTKCGKKPKCPSLQRMVLVVDHLVAATYGTRG